MDQALLSNAVPPGQHLHATSTGGQAQVDGDPVVLPSAPPMPAPMQQQMMLAQNYQQQMGVAVPTTANGQLQQPTTSIQNRNMIVHQQPQMNPQANVGYQLLSSLQKITIREKIRLSQIFFGWERANQYQIETTRTVIPGAIVGGGGGPGPPFPPIAGMAPQPSSGMAGQTDVNPVTTTETVMYAHERSTCLERQCCPAGVRGYEMTISLFGGTTGGAGVLPAGRVMPGSGTSSTTMQMQGRQQTTIPTLGGYQDPNPWNSTLIPYLYFKKPTACAICCFCRPEIELVDLHLNTTAGYIENPFNCCGMHYVILDATRRPIFEVHGDSCQCGLICRCPCGPCNKVVFDVFELLPDGGAGRTARGSKVAEIRKHWGGFLRDWIAGDAGLYEVEFGAIGDVAHKGLLIACALFLSEEYFTRGGFDQRDESLLGGLFG
ncbi:unnamed protein product [Amoebophrya sp. A120]|nr:unnamed protein product [Amoebophrya sp. A120]|eukprot:GSA120T00015894001.1